MDLETLRARISQPKVKPIRKKGAWRPPEIEDFGYGAALNFDQALTKTGWSLLVNSPDRPLQVLHGGLLRPEETELTGFEGDFAKAKSMKEKMEAVLTEHSLGVEVVVHEMPSVATFNDSSKSAALMLRLANDDCYCCPIVMISRLSVYARLVGHAHAAKSAGTATVNRLITSRNTTHWNQDVHDSVLLGLEWLYDKRMSK